MDRRAFKKFITKRSTIWTLSLCMTGILVLGGITLVDRTRRTKDETTQTENDLGQYAYLEEETTEKTEEEPEKLFPTLENAPEDDDLAQASGNAVTDGTSGILPGATQPDGMEEAAGQAVADGTDEAGTAAASVNGAGTVADGVNGAGTVTDGADGTETAEALADGADGAGVAADGANEAEAAADGTDGAGTAADGADGTGTAEPLADDGAAEASSSDVISEQALLDQGISFTEAESLMWPAAGTILIDYSMDGSVYFPTLNQYKYNPALIISSDVGNQVLAAAKGIVESVFVDEETGTTLVMNIGNGYRLTYGQLKEVTASEGDVLEKGAILGYISEPTKYYSEEGSNLYFRMTQEDTAVDPVLYLE